MTQLAANDLDRSLPKNGFVRQVLTLRPPRIAIGLLLAAWLVATAFSDWRIEWIGIGIEAAAAAVIGLSIMMLAWLEFHRHENPVCHTAQPILMVGTGPFRYSRNPMYLGIFIALCAPFLGSGSLVFLGPPIIFFAIINWVVVPYEERKMRTSFGDDYIGYAQRVRRWI